MLFCDFSAVSKYETAQLELSKVLEGAVIGDGSTHLLTRLETVDDAVGLAQRLAEQVGPNSKL